MRERINLIKLRQFKQNVVLDCTKIYLKLKEFRIHMYMFIYVLNNITNPCMCIANQILIRILQAWKCHPHLFGPMT